MKVDLQKLRRLAEKAAQINSEVANDCENPNLWDKQDEANDRLHAVATPTTIIELLDRIDRAEKVCNMMRQNTGMHCSAVGKCMGCQKESTPSLQMYCRKCIDKALAEWRGE